MVECLEKMREDRRAGVDILLGPIALEIAIATCVMFHVASLAALPPLAIGRNKLPTSKPPSETEDDATDCPALPHLPARRNPEPGTSLRNAANGARSKLVIRSNNSPPTESTEPDCLARGPASPLRLRQ